MFSPLLAAGGVENSSSLWLGIMAAVAALAFLSLASLFASRYRRCPSNRVLVIYGKVGGGNTAHCIHGGAALVMPLIQDYGYLNLEPIQIEVPLRGALSIENIRVNVPSVFTVAIGTEPEVMQNAAIRLLGLNTEEIKKQAEHIIFGQLRQVIASMRIEDINRHREQFLQRIQASLEPELRKIGLVLINVNITDITDESGYIQAIGKKAASQAVQQALIDVAEQEKVGAIGVAAAQQTTAVQVANAHKLREIGTREASREQAVRLAELDKEQKIGEQRAGFERDAQVKDAERTMRIALADANAKAVSGEAVAQAEIALAQANLQVKQAEAFQLGETKKRQAEAAVQEAQNRAQAKAALADAERVEAERRAAVEAPAKAEKARIIVEAEAAAERIRLEAEGQAKAIFAKLEAEAKGQYEILSQKAEGLRRIVEACGGATQAYQLLMLEHVDRLAETSAKAISNIKFDKVVVWENGGSNGTGGNTSHFLQGLVRSMPPMMQVLKDIGGVEMPDYLARLKPETTTPNGATTVPDVAAPDAPPSAASS
ncbi:MAG TPA: SPFH domain-containing protein [Gemmataceae bacterium]|nr:SPFH domain-containing protein [Gemmataceae bacterium]